MTPSQERVAAEDLATLGHLEADIEAKFVDCVEFGALKIAGVRGAGGQAVETGFSRERRVEDAVAVGGDGLDVAAQRGFAAPAERDAAELVRAAEAELAAVEGVVDAVVIGKAVEDRLIREQPAGGREVRSVSANCRKRSAGNEIEPAGGVAPEIADDVGFLAEEFDLRE